MAAPKGNKFAVGNNGGRPAFFTDPEELQKKVDEFFETSEHITICGLALHLGFESRRSLYDYEENKEFSLIIKKARLRVENEYEKKLSGINAAGPIFALKNMSWRDQQQVQLADNEGGKIKEIIPENRLIELISSINNLGK